MSATFLFGIVVGSISEDVFVVRAMNMEDVVQTLKDRSLARCHGCG